MECMTLAEIFATTIFSVKLMHDCISLLLIIRCKVIACGGYAAEKAALTS